MGVAEADVPDRVLGWPNVRPKEGRPKEVAVKAIWNGQVIAESDDTVALEGYHYFPRASVDARYLKPSATTTVCPWKGTASYHTLVVDGDENTDAAWYYPSPRPSADSITGRVAFWRGVRVVEK